MLKAGSSVLNEADATIITHVTKDLGKLDPMDFAVPLFQEKEK